MIDFLNKRQKHDGKRRKWSSAFFPCPSVFNSLPNNKFLALTKFKAFAGDKIIAIQKFKFVYGRIENIVGKEENTGFQHFLPFPQRFLKLSFPEVLKVRIVW